MSITVEQWMDKLAIVEKFEKAERGTVIICARCKTRNEA